MKSLKQITLTTWIALIISFYVGISYCVYRLKHPEQTETQLALNFVDAMMWK